MMGITGLSSASSDSVIESKLDVLLHARCRLIITRNNLPTEIHLLAVVLGCRVRRRFMVLAYP